MTAENRPTKEIAEALLPEEGMTLDHILGALGVYYWWNHDKMMPEEMLEDILQDSPKRKILTIAETLHDNLDFCLLQFGTDEGCGKSFKKCFRRSLSTHNKKKRFKDIDRESLIDEVAMWYDGLNDNELEALEADEDYQTDLSTVSSSVLGRAYRQYVVRTLLAAGADELEARDALNAIETEYERRGLFEESDRLLTEYTNARQAGISHIDFINNGLIIYLLENSDNENGFWSLYEDVIDFMNWPTERKIALARRYISEHTDLFDLLDESYELYTNKRVPSYQYRFAPQWD